MVKYREKKTKEKKISEHKIVENGKKERKKERKKEHKLFDFFLCALKRWIQKHRRNVSPFENYNKQ